MLPGMLWRHARHSGQLMPASAKTGVCEIWACKHWMAACRGQLQVRLHRRIILQLLPPASPASRRIIQWDADSARAPCHTTAAR